MFDIAKQKQIQESLNKNDSWFSAFFRTNPIAMSIIRCSDGYFIDVNESFLKLFEYHREDVTSHHHSQVHSIFDPVSYKEIESAIVEGIPFRNLKISLYTRSGSLKEISMSFKSIRTDGENAILMLYHDFTQQKQRDYELQMLQQEIETFRYTVSHDLLDPLRHINSYVHLIQKNKYSSLDTMSQRYLKIISESAHQMGHLIEDLLIFSCMGKSEILMTTVNMEKLVRDIIDEIGEEPNVQSVEWNLGNLPNVEGELFMLRVLLTNLIKNALLSSQTCRPAKIDIDSVRGEQGRHVFLVRDNGLGLDKGHTDTLQGAFQNPQSPEAFYGASLKLATVKRVIYRHRGSIWAEGTAAQGKTIYFSIPKGNNSLAKHA